MDVESQQTLDEAINRATNNLQKVVAEAIGAIGQQAMSLIIAIQQERKALESFVGGLTVEITIPKITIVVKEQAK